MKKRHRRVTTLLAASALVLTPAPAQAAESVNGTVVTGGTALNTRSGPSASSGRTGSLANGSEVSIVCRIAGQFISGTVTNTGFWDRLTTSNYISDAYVRRSAAVPKCTSAAAAPAVSGAWMLPVSAGLISGFRTAQRPAHDGVDLAASRFTAIRAASPGSVIRVVCNVSRGTCDVDGNSSLTGCGWYVEVLHAGDIVTRYCHMVRRPSVTVGQRVARGSILGYVGTSGSSSGPHLHLEVHTGVPATRDNAINPIAFFAARGLTIS